MNKSESMKKTVRELDKVLETKNLRKGLSLFSKNCKIEMLGIELKGKKGAKKWFNWLFESFFKIKVRNLTVFVQKGKIFKEYVLVATLHNGDTIRSKQSEVIKFQGNKIKTIRLYFDRIDFKDLVADNFMKRIFLDRLVEKPLDNLKK